MNFKECKTFHASRKTKETGGDFCICNRINHNKCTGDDQVISEKQKKKFHQIFQYPYLNNVIESFGEPQGQRVRSHLAQISNKSIVPRD